MLERMDLKLTIMISGGICLLTGIVVFSASISQAVAQMGQMQMHNSNATAEMRNMVFGGYENSTLGINFQHPKNWPISTQDIGPITVIKLNTTRESDMNTIPPIILLSVGALPQNSKTLDDLTRINMAEAAKTNNFHLIESNATNLGGIGAKKILYLYSSDDPSLTLPLKSMDIWTVKNGKKYTFSYIDVQRDFDKQLPVVNKILDSVKIK